MKIPAILANLELKHNVGRMHKLKLNLEMDFVWTWIGLGVDLEWTF